MHQLSQKKITNNNKCETNVNYGHKVINQTQIKHNYTRKLGNTGNTLNINQ